MYCTRNICAICLLLMVYNWTPGWICPPVQISGHLALICEDNIIAYVHSYPQENGGTQRPKLLLLLCPLVLPRHVPTWTHTVPSRVGFVIWSRTLEPGSGSYTRGPTARACLAKKTKRAAPRLFYFLLLYHGLTGCNSITSLRAVTLHTRPCFIPSQVLKRLHF